MQLQRQYLGVGDLVPSNPGLPFWASGTGMAGSGCGIGDLVPSRPGLPFWPSGGGMGDLVSSSPGLPFWPAGNGMGDQVPTSAMYPIEQNSVLQYYGGLGFHSYYGAYDRPSYPDHHPLSSGMGDCGCGCGGKCGGHSGMSGITEDLSAMVSNLTSGNFSGAWSSFMSALEEPIFGTVPLWMVSGGALLAYAMFFSGGKHSRYTRGRRALASARTAYA